MQKILNFGSLNIDSTYRVEHIVRPGETIPSTSLDVFSGGKGLNQSMALAKAGGNVYHAGKIGADGRFLKEQLEEQGVNCAYIEESNIRSGNALIQVDKEGQNCIILFGGANHDIREEQVDRVLAQFGKEDILVCQNELNITAYLIQQATEKGMKIAFNPSPSCSTA